MNTKAAGLSVLLIVRWPVGGIKSFLRYTYTCPEFSSYRIGIVATCGPDISSIRRSLSSRDVELFPCKPNWFSFQKSIFRALSSRRYAIIHSHGLTSAMFTASAVHLRRLRHVITLHDVFNENLFVGIKGIIRRTVVGQTLASAYAIHTISRDVQTNLIQYFPRLDKSKLTFIPNGIPVTQFGSGSTRDLRRELGLFETDFLIGFLGRFMAPKGFRYLVDAIKSLTTDGSPPRRPIVIAVGSGGYIREEKLRIEQLGLQDYFRFLPFLDDVTSTLRGLDVVAVPSLSEACPLLPMEAMVCGVPIIATNCIGLREVVEGTPATIVPPADPKALANALNLHIVDTVQLTDAKRFAKTAAARFDVRNSAAKLSQFYETVCLAK